MSNLSVTGALTIVSVLFIGACSGGDADNNVERNLFAVGDQVETVEDGGPVEGDVSTNDQGEDLVFTLLPSGLEEHGTLEFNIDGTFTYTPDADFSGEDSFYYVASHQPSGESSTAKVTINVVSDYETVEEYGWQLSWSDEFDSGELDSLIWNEANALVVDGVLQVSADENSDAFAKTNLPSESGRIEVSMQLPQGEALSSMFTLQPIADMYEGDNAIVGLMTKENALVAGAEFGLNIESFVQLNQATTETVSTEFHLYAIEWNPEQFRFYVDDVHVLTIDTLTVWGYNAAGEDIVIDQAGPFNQDMEIALELMAQGAGASGDLMIDYVRVWQCDPEVDPNTEDCESNVDRAITKAASDWLPEYGSITQDIYTDELQELSWMYNKEVAELEIASWNDPVVVSDFAVEGSQDDTLIDVTHSEGDANISITAPGLNLVGEDAVLNFDLFIDSEATTTETLDLRMETVWPYMGILTWTVADLTLDEWVTYEIPVSEFLENPFLAPEWLNWIEGVGEGDPLPLDTSEINNLLTIEFHGGVHFQLDNIAISCIASDSCFKLLPTVQEEPQTGAAPIRYEAENYTDAGDIQTESTADIDGDLNVGWVDPGDFLVYNIDVPTTGSYTIDYRLASQGGSDGFEVSVDGTVVDSQTVEDTGGWQNWITQSSSAIQLDQGTHTLRIDFVGGAININWFALNPPLAIVVEGEDFVNAGDVQTEPTEDEGGGENVGWIDPGDFLEYTVNIPADGAYTIEYRVASLGGSDGFETSFGGTVVDTQAVPDTGAWQAWESLTAEVELTAGEQTMRLDFIGGAININWIRISN